MTFFAAHGVVPNGTVSTLLYGFCKSVAGVPTPILAERQIVLRGQTVLSVSGTVSGLAAGNYTVGLCGKNWSSNATNTDNDAHQSGWVMVTN